MTFEDINNIFTRALNFISDDVWRIRASDLPFSKSFWLRFLRIVILTFRGFREDNCQLRASALTFYSLVSIVPIFALGFGIAKGFGFEDRLRDDIMSKIPEQNDAVIVKVIDFSHSLLEQAKGGVVAGVGFLVLLWTVYRVLESIELSFNEIWGIKKSRSVARKFSDYLAIMLICPFLLILSSGATGFVIGKISVYVPSYWGLSVLFDSFAIQFSRYIVIWLLFTFLYSFMPNTKVKTSSAVMAGIVAGTCYQVLQLILINCQMLVAKYNAIYGSFSALPLFLMWMQFSWFIVLFGSEVAFACQNSDNYEFEPDAHGISDANKRLLRIGVVHLIVKNFYAGEAPWTAEKIARYLQVPIRLVRSLLFESMTAGLVNEVNIEDELPGYQPARSPENLTICQVIEATDKVGKGGIPQKRTEELLAISGQLEQLDQSLRALPPNKLIKDI